MAQRANKLKRPPEEFPIVGIGGSAGGFEAFQRLLKVLPGDTGMAFVFVQHLDPTHESFAAGLLSKMTKMKVAEAKDGMEIQPNCIFVIPPNKSMTITDGHLKLEPRQEIRGRHMPIDYFLNSLADKHGSRAIGVVLSGSASDGTLGMKAIKAEGGLTFAQEPSDAKYDSMPRSAITAGCVDFVLPVEKIGQELARLGKHPYIRSSGPSAHEAEPDAGAETEHDGEYDRIFVLLKKASGVDFKYYKHTTIRRRIARRMVVHKLDTIPQYVKLLESTPAEVEALYQDILIKVTRFFRDPEVFEFLKSKVFPATFKDRAADAPIRVWVPGCATGEEVYSIAICLLEYMGDMAVNPSIQIFATDVSELAIHAAREGRYLENISMDVSPERLRRFFVQVEGGYQISKPIRDLCIFARQNMTSDPPFSKLDLISCRNVLIYLDVRLQKRVIPLFHYALKPNGHLMLGSSETIGTFGELFTMVDKHFKIFLKKPGVVRAQVDFATAYSGEIVETPRPAREIAHDDTWRMQDVQRDADRVILSRFGAAGAIVDDEMEILQFRGDTSPFLEHQPGEPSLNLLKMVRGGLAIELRAIIHDARARGATVVKENVALTAADKMRMIRVEVTPLQAPSIRGHYYLVLFAEVPSPDVTELEPPARRSDLPADVLQRRIDQLATELTATKHHLQSIIEEQEATNEELQSANEEVLSSNEELQSINEELETAKEELQSTNEELTTVNEELQNRNIELTQVNNDLTNLLSSVNIPIVMLGNDLRIRRFTPLAEKLLSLIPTDIGRPISDIKPRVEVPDLGALVAEVIDTVTVKELEVRDKEGRWYSMRVRPYKTRENKIDGAVIALLDIDAPKRAAIEIRETRDLLEATIQAIQEPILILDLNAKAQKANAAFHTRFKLDGGLENRSVFDLAHGKWNVPSLRNLIENLRKNSVANQDASVPNPYGGTPLRVTARRLDFADQLTGRILLIFAQ